MSRYFIYLLTVIQDAWPEYIDVSFKVKKQLGGGLEWKYLSWSILKSACYESTLDVLRVTLSSVSCCDNGELYNRTAIFNFAGFERDYCRSPFINYDEARNRIVKQKVKECLWLDIITSKQASSEVTESLYRNNPFLRTPKRTLWTMQFLEKNSDRSTIWVAAHFPLISIHTSTNDMRNGEKTSRNRGNGMHTALKGSSKGSTGHVMLEKYLNVLELWAFLVWVRSGSGRGNEGRSGEWASVETERELGEGEVFGTALKDL